MLRKVILGSALAASIGLFMWVHTPSAMNTYVVEKSNEEMLDHALKSTVNINVNGGLGTGVFLSDDGYILTCDHVIGKRLSDKDILIQVYKDPRDYRVDVIASSTLYDLALLKVKTLPKKKFSYLNFAKPDSIKVGSNIYVVGNPMGYSWTVTKGIISTLHRTSMDGDHLQYDATTIFGNSGGPVINENGDIVGIVRLLYATPVGTLNFAVTVDHCIEFLNFAFNE